MKIRLFALVMFAILLASGAWSSEGRGPCDVKVMKAPSPIIEG